MSKPTFNLKKRILAAFLVLLVTLFYGYAVIPQVMGSLGDVGTPAVLFTGAEISGRFEAVNWNPFFKGAADGFWYGLTSYTDGGSYPIRLRQSDDNGVSWDTAANGDYHWRTVTVYNKVKYCWAYDPTSDVFHLFWHYTLAYPSTSYIRYARGIPNGIGGISIVNQTNIASYSSNTHHSCLSITLQNQKPVLCISWYNHTVAAYRLDLFFGNNPDPTSWTCQGLALGISFNEVHAVNSTHIAAIAKSFNSDSRIVARWFTEAGGYLGYDYLTDEDVEADSAHDTNNIYWSNWATVSDNLINSTLYADEIYIAYVNTTQHLNAIVWDVETQTQTDFDHILAGATAIYTPTVAKDEDSYFVAACDRNASAYTVHVRIWERNPVTGSYSDPLYVTSLDFATSLYQPVSMSKMALDGYIVYEYTESVTRYTLNIEAEGVSTYVPPKPVSWFGLYGNFFIGLIGTMMMIISPSWLAYKLKTGWRDAELTLERAVWALLMFIVGFGLLMCWLGGFM
jgi:hypothetical protein